MRQIRKAGIPLVQYQFRNTRAQYLHKLLCLWGTKPQNFMSSLWFPRWHSQYPPQNKHRLLLWRCTWFSLSPPLRYSAFGSGFQSCPAHFLHPLPPLGFLSAEWSSWKPHSMAVEERTHLDYTAAVHSKELREMGIKFLAQVWLGSLIKLRL